MLETLLILENKTRRIQTLHTTSGWKELMIIIQTLLMRKDTLIVNYRQGITRLFNNNVCASKPAPVVTLVTLVRNR